MKRPVKIKLSHQQQRLQQKEKKMEASFEGPVTDQWSNIIYSELTQESILIISHSRLHVHKKNREKSIFEISLSRS